VRFDEGEDVEQTLSELEHHIQRLKIEYDQYFMGALRREPTLLRGKIQRTLTKYTNEPPRNTLQKFRFNQLMAKFQSYRSMWGRSLREIEAGTYKRHRFKAQLHESEAAEEKPPEKGPAQSGPSPVDKLYDALADARKRTGESAPLDREKLAALVQQQTAALRKKHGAARIGFKVVIEGKKAKLRATVKG